jgi:hypothetical protein
MRILRLIRGCRLFECEFLTFSFVFVYSFWKSWLADHDVDCALGALLVESVGGLVPSRRAAVAKAPKTKTKKKIVLPIFFF